MTKLLAYLIVGFVILSGAMVVSEWDIPRRAYADQAAEEAEEHEEKSEEDAEEAEERRE